MRYFLGLPLPKELNQQIERLQRDWPNERWPVHFRHNVEPHITVKAPFTDAQTRWLQQIDTIASAIAPLTILLDSIDFFTAKVIHWSVASKPLLALHQEITQLFPQSQLTDRERQAYIPHLTLAIANHKLSPSDQIDLASWVEQRFDRQPFEITKLHLYAHGTDQSYQIAKTIILSGSW